MLTCGDEMIKIEYSNPAFLEVLMTLNSRFLLGAATTMLTLGATSVSAGFSAGFDPASPFLSATGAELTVRGDAAAKDGILDLGQTGL
ncbi:MAG: hypothetical protein RL318_2509, partial [Fibrobacterota bacterium]